MWLHRLHRLQWPAGGGRARRLAVVLAAGAVACGLSWSASGAEPADLAGRNAGLAGWSDPTLLVGEPAPAPGDTASLTGAGWPDTPCALYWDKVRQGAPPAGCTVSGGVLSATLPLPLDARPGSKHEVRAVATDPSGAFAAQPVSQVVGLVVGPAVVRLGSDTARGADRARRGDRVRVTGLGFWPGSAGCAVTLDGAEVGRCEVLRRTYRLFGVLDVPADAAGGDHLVSCVRCLAPGEPEPVPAPLTVVVPEPSTPPATTVPPTTVPPTGPESPTAAASSPAAGDDQGGGFPGWGLVVALAGAAGLAAGLGGWLLRSRRPGGRLPPDPGSPAGWGPLLPGVRPVRVGFSDVDGADLPPGAALIPGAPHLFWVEVGPLLRAARAAGGAAGSAVDRSERLDVAVSGFPDGLALAEAGRVQAVTLPGVEPVAGRIGFPVRAPATGPARLRCGIYAHGVLLQSRLVTVPVGGDAGHPGWEVELDYVATHALDPADLQGLSSHALSVLVNDDGEGTHGLRFLGPEQVTGDVTFGEGELTAVLGHLRRRLSDAVFTGTPGGRPAYGYPGGFQPDRLGHDLGELARWGCRFYVQLLTRFSGRRPDGTPVSGPDLLGRLTEPARLQLVTRTTIGQVLPVAFVYDYPLDADAPGYALCQAYEHNARAGAALLDTPCFHGLCPQRTVLDLVCPGGFWGFRHVIGQPRSIEPTPSAGAERPLAPVPAGRVRVVAGLSRDEAFRLRDGHVAGLRRQLAGADWVQETAVPRLMAALAPPAPEPHLVYLYCHGGVDRDVAWLEIGAPQDADRGHLEASTFLMYRVRWAGVHPLVLVNGCSTAALAPGTPFGLVEPLVRLVGAAGVLGTEVAIPEELACAFAEEVVPRFVRDGERIGDAIRAGRLALLARGDPCGLAYLPFVSDDLGLTVHRPAAPPAAIGTLEGDRT